jgi:hypothetical protein
MGALASLAQAAVRVEPGGEAELEIRVHNNGRVVDEFELAGLGDAAAWISTDPERVSLLPGDEATVRVIFRPPREHSVAAGPIPFGIMVRSREDPQGSVVEEGTVEVGQFVDDGIELLPRTARGRRSAIYELAVDNRGNRPLNVEILPLDPDGRFAFRPDPPAIVIEPGAAGFSRIKVAPRKRFLRGPSQTKTFQVHAIPTDAPALVAEGTFLQEPLLPRWTGKALALALAALLALVLLWFLIGKPLIRSQARDAAAEEAEAAKESAEAAQGAAESAAADAADAGEAVAAVEEGGGVDAGDGIAAPGPTLSSTGGRVQLLVDAGAVGSDRLAGIPGDKVFQLTDIVFENAAADSGVVRVKRGDQVLLQVSLDSFRDVDYHFISPLTFPAGTPVTFEAICANASGAACRPAVYLGGWLQ